MLAEGGGGLKTLKTVIEGMTEMSQTRRGSTGVSLGAWLGVARRGWLWPSRAFGWTLSVLGDGLAGF